ncbi:MAG: DUF4911 domain-containing protein [Desulfobacterales bacterium]|nr:MAG: DUF4911 domain-containing protein [Desulfobacterales bacterium]
METKKEYYRVERCKISFLKFIFEAYDGIAVVTTKDAQQGLVELSIAPGCEDVVAMVLEDLKRDILIEVATLSDFAA